MKFNLKISLSIIIFFILVCLMLYFFFSNTGSLSQKDETNSTFSTKDSSSTPENSKSNKSNREKRQKKDTDELKNTDNAQTEAELSYSSSIEKVYPSQNNPTPLEKPLEKTLIKDQNEFIDIFKYAKKDVNKEMFKTRGIVSKFNNIRDKRYSIKLIESYFDKILKETKKDVKKQDLFNEITEAKKCYKELDEFFDGSIKDYKQVISKLSSDIEYDTSKYLEKLRNTFTPDLKKKGEEIIKFYDDKLDCFKNILKLSDNCTVWKDIKNITLNDLPPINTLQIERILFESIATYIKCFYGALIDNIRQFNTNAINILLVLETYKNQYEAFKKVYDYFKTNPDELTNIQNWRTREERALSFKKYFEIFDYNYEEVLHKFIKQKEHDIPLSINSEKKLYRPRLELSDFVAQYF